MSNMKILEINNLNKSFDNKEILKNIDKNSIYTELIYHYKQEPKIYFYTEFKNNVKITYKADILYCEALLASENVDKEGI